MNYVHLSIIAIHVICFIYYLMNYFRKEGATLKVKRIIMILVAITTFVVSPLGGVINIITFILMEFHYRGSTMSKYVPIGVAVLLTLIQQGLYRLTHSDIDIQGIINVIYCIVNCAIFIIEKKTYIIVKKETKEY